MKSLIRILVGGILVFGSLVCIVKADAGNLTKATYNGIPWGISQGSATRYITIKYPDFTIETRSNGSGVIISATRENPRNLRTLEILNFNFREKGGMESVLYSAAYSNIALKDGEPLFSDVNQQQSRNVEKEASIVRNDLEKTYGMTPFHMESFKVGWNNPENSHLVRDYYYRLDSLATLVVLRQKLFKDDLLVEISYFPYRFHKDLVGQVKRKKAQKEILESPPTRVGY